MISKVREIQITLTFCRNLHLEKAVWIILAIKLFRTVRTGNKRKKQFICNDDDMKVQSVKNARHRKEEYDSKRGDIFEREMGPNPSFMFMMQ